MSGRRVVECGRIPDLCIEIASRRAAYDRTTKRLICAQAGMASW